MINLALNSQIGEISSVVETYDYIAYSQDDSMEYGDLIDIEYFCGVCSPDDIELYQQFGIINEVEFFIHCSECGVLLVDEPPLFCCDEHLTNNFLNENLALETLLESLKEKEPMCINFMRYMFSQHSYTDIEMKSILSVFRGIEDYTEWDSWIIFRNVYLRRSIRGDIYEV